MRFEQYIRSAHDKFVLLRHDVDKLPGNSLAVAKIEHELGIIMKTSAWRLQD